MAHQWHTLAQDGPRIKNSSFDSAKPVPTSYRVLAMDMEIQLCVGGRTGLLPSTWSVPQDHLIVSPSLSGRSRNPDPNLGLEASWGTKIGVGSWIPVATGTTGGGRIQQLKDPARRFWLTRFGRRSYNSGKPDSVTWGIAECRTLTIQCFSARRGARWSRAERVAGCHRPLRT